MVHKRCVKQLRIVCGTTISPQHAKLIDTNGRHPIAGNGHTESIDRHRPSGASVTNARDPMTKQKMSTISEPGPLKRTQGNTIPR